jgi:predicted glycosyltransferase
MRVWLDVLTPKQANLFAELHDRLNAKGCKVLVTTRHYREVNELLELRKLKTSKVGRHGGAYLKDKLLESSKRVTALAEFVGDYSPDVAISFSSPEAARVAFGLGIPHYCVSDSPHAEAVCRLTIPLSEKLFTPWVIPSYAWNRYGIRPRDVVRYRALDPIVWINCKNNPKALDELNLDLTKPVVVIRTSEEFAAYLSDRSAARVSTTMDIIANILDLSNGELQLVVLPRYDEQGEKFRKRFGTRIIAPQHVIDGVSLLRASSVFIGGGGTMSAEAALLGVPVISYYPGDQTFVEKFLVKYGLIERILDPGRIAHRTIGISKSREFRDYYRKKSSKLVQTMEDPIRIMLQRILK